MDVEQLTACSLCLRVLRGSEWVEAARAIRELRTYDLGAAPRLLPGVCDSCARKIADRRLRTVERVAA